MTTETTASRRVHNYASEEEIARVFAMGIDLEYPTFCVWQAFFTEIDGDLDFTPPHGTGPNPLAAATDLLDTDELRIRYNGDGSRISAVLVDEYDKPRPVTLTDTRIDALLTITKPVVDLHPWEGGYEERHLFQSL